jgi:succinyl-CoA synthetase beta subunit
LKIHEYQAKEILSRYGVVVPCGKVCSSADEVYAAAEEFGGKVVVKAQIHAGGRGKGGGVCVVGNPEQAKAEAERIFANPLVTHQTGPQGQEVRKVLVEEGLDIDRELYAGMVLDRDISKISLILSGEGGVEIEEVARTSPDKIMTAAINPVTGLSGYQVRKLAYHLNLDKLQVAQAEAFLLGVYRAFVELDASLLEINPLVLTSAGKIVALDAKMNFDENALYRHPDVTELRDFDEEEPAEVEASQHGLSYIRLDGNIGCMVNGAGLAMATMDIIKLFGGEPANFLDVGGGTDAKRVKTAFKIILSDNNVNSILVNIFGGIVRCDAIAEGMVAAVEDVGIEVPLVVRLQGTKVEEGRKILAESGLNIISVESMQEAAREVVKASNSNSR